MAKDIVRRTANGQFDLRGRKFGFLTVTDLSDQIHRSGERMWQCVCDCGSSKTVPGSMLKRGQSKSCGCFRRMRAGRLNFIHGRTRDIEYQMFADARKRARNSGISFDIELDDIVVPEFCPALGIQLNRNATRLDDDLPSLDRMVPKLGYVKGNVAVISWRANKLKNNATSEELEGIAKWLRSMGR